MRTAASSKVRLVEGICFLGEDIVLVRHAKMGWSIPGGHVEPGEDREVREETGTEVLDAVEVLVDEYKNYEAHIFVCRVQGELHAEDKDILEVRAFPFPDALTLLPSWQREIVERAVKKLSAHKK